MGSAESFDKCTIKKIMALLDKSVMNVLKFIQTETQILVVHLLGLESLFKPGECLLLVLSFCIKTFDLQKSNKYSETFNSKMYSK